MSHFRCKSCEKYYKLYKSIIIASTKIQNIFCRCYGSRYKLSFTTKEEWENRNNSEKHEDGGIDDFMQESKSFQGRFWNEYLYPNGYKKIFDELFSENIELEKKSKHYILHYNEMMVITLCEWIRQHGFFHYFQNKICLIDMNPLFLSCMVATGANIRCFSIEDIASEFPALVHLHIGALK